MMKKILKHPVRVSHHQQTPLLHTSSPAHWRQTRQFCEAIESVQLKVRPFRAKMDYSGTFWNFFYLCNGRSIKNFLPPQRSGQRGRPICTTRSSLCYLIAKYNTPFATRCSKKAKSWRNAPKTGAAGATAQLGLPGLLRGRK